MLSVLKKANLKNTVWLILGIGLGWISHNYLANIGKITKNYGISFGLSSGWLIFLSVIFILILFGFWWREKSFVLGVILVGGIVNLIDRLVFGYVRDYWQFFLVYNNLADWLIAIGGLFFLKDILWKKKLK